MTNPPDRLTPTLIGDADPRRRHHAWQSMAEGRVELCDGLAALAARWRDVQIAHELELATFVTAFERDVETLVGEHRVRVWAALDELRDATPPWRAPTLERQLSPSADPEVAAALAALRVPGAAPPAWSWGGHVPAVRERLDRLLGALRDVAHGRLVADLFAPVGPTRSSDERLAPGDDAVPS